MRKQFPRVAMGGWLDAGSNWEKTQTLQTQPGLVLAGRMMVMVEAFTHRPRWQLYTEEAAANDKRFAPEILTALPRRGIADF